MAERLVFLADPTMIPEAKISTSQKFQVAVLTPPGRQILLIFKELDGFYLNFGGSIRGLDEPSFDRRVYNGSLN